MTPPRTSATNPAANRKAGRSADDVNGRLEDIEAYLTELAKALDEYKWGTDPLELKTGGTGTGSTPPRWPP